MDGTGLLFAALQRELGAQADTRVVSYPADEPLGYDDLLELVPIPPGPFAIVAESFSGPLAIRLASRHGERVRALVLAATFARGPSKARLCARIAPLLFRLPPPAFALRRSLLDTTATPDEVSALRAAIVCVAPPVLARRLEEIAAVDVRKEFASSTAPTLYIAAGRDRLVGTRAAAELRRLRDDMVLHVVDAPHLVLQTRPRECAAIIAPFIEAAAEQRLG
jgi:pimeloyl-ACP methyl ester carboxylesterase